jgi:tetratricopeptide (TPR) repeat protein
MIARYLIAGAALVFGARVTLAQSPTDHVAAGDQAHLRMQPSQALVHYQEALAADSNDYQALWRASREAVDLGEFEPDEAKRKEYYTEGERFARRAVAVNSDDAEGHFTLARALGRVALSLGKKERVRYAKQVRAEALTALQHDSLHAGALHVMGRWNAEIMRLSGFSRFMAKNFLGGDVFGEASWNKAVTFMERSVAQDPGRLVHHLDLAEIYRDRDEDGDREKARAEFETVINGRATEYNDRFYKQEAERELAELK